MDHRSLVHNFENGVWMHYCPVLLRIEEDLADTFAKCVRMGDSNAKWNILRRFVRATAKIFAPLM